MKSSEGKSRLTSAVVRFGDARILATVPANRTHDPTKLLKTEGLLAVASAVMRCPREDRKAVMASANGLFFATC
jgi:hypothetical protein